VIELPVWAVPNGAQPIYQDFGGFLVPGLGGEVQRIDRMGNRFGISVTFPPVVGKQRGRILVSRLIRGKTEGVRLEYPLLDFAPGQPGTVVVDGAGQSGRTLLVRGAEAGYAFREGQPFSIENADGRHYLHFVDEETIADGSGDAELPISPMLRYEFADGDTCHFAKPMIEGFIMGEEWRWQMSVERFMYVECEIMERA
jgi:hypothetical protein